MNPTRGALALYTLLICVGFLHVKANLVFNVKHKYNGNINTTISTLKNHDIRRHGRNLASLNLPVGGNGKFTETGLYYTKLAIGTPSKDYHFQIDTGSDLMWVNCAGCDNCLTEGRFGFDLTLYDVKASSTANQVTCEQDFCNVVYERGYSNCTEGKSCNFFTSYYDGSQSGGYFVKDNIKFDQSSGDGKTQSLDANIGFGCSFIKGGKSGTSTDLVDGIIGLGQARSSLISQLRMNKKINNRVFSHCFDDKKGGGIFAIGQIVEPQVDNVVPLVPLQPHYTIQTNAIEVQGKVIDLGRGIFNTGMQTVVDSGATLAYLPGEVYDQVISLIVSNQPDLEPFLYEKQFTCFAYQGDVEKGFPIINFKFKTPATMKVYPSEYLVQTGKEEWCIGFQKNEIRENGGGEMILLGDLVLANKLVMYDLENQALGWTEHSCSSSIKVKDDASGKAYDMNATGAEFSIFSKGNRIGQNALIFHLLMAVVYYLIN